MTIQDNDETPISHDEDDQPLTLVVGDQSAWTKNGGVLPQIAGFRFIDIDALTSQTLEAFPASIVLSTLMVRDRDAIEIARTLSELSFQGRYRVVADGLPNPDLVSQEVAAAAPEIDFEVLNLPPFELFS